MIPIYQRKPRKPRERKPRATRREVTPTASVSKPRPDLTEIKSEPVASPRIGPILYGIDPGPESSAIVGLRETGAPFHVEIWPNVKILEFLRGCHPATRNSPHLLAIESMASYGMPVGDPVFVSCYWIGRFAEAWGGTVRLIKAPTVRAHLCGTPRGKKAHVRQALLNRYSRTGGGARPEIGTKGNPGPLYGFKSHAWSALAVAIAARESDLGVTLP